MRQGGKHYSDMGHSLFLNSTCDILENKQQGHATLPFLKFNMRHRGPPIKGPCIGIGTFCVDIVWLIIFNLIVIVWLIRLITCIFNLIGTSMSLLISSLQWSDMSPMTLSSHTHISYTTYSVLRLDYCGLGQFYGVPVFSLYTCHCLIYSLLSYTN